MSEQRKWYLRWDETGRYRGDEHKSENMVNYEGWTYEEFEPKECPKPELPDGLYLVSVRNYPNAIRYRTKKGGEMYDEGKQCHLTIPQYIFLEYYGPGEDLTPEQKRHYGEE